MPVFHSRFSLLERRLSLFLVVPILLWMIVGLTYVRSDDPQILLWFRAVALPLAIVGSGYVALVGLGYLVVRKVRKVSHAK